MECVLPDSVLKIEVFYFQRYPEIKSTFEFSIVNFEILVGYRLSIHYHLMPDSIEVATVAVAIFIQCSKDPSRGRLSALVPLVVGKKAVV